MSTTTKYNPSVNIVRDYNKELYYIPTDNSKKVFDQIINDFVKGTRSFNIIGAYGTGKSSFLWAFEKNLNGGPYHFGKVGRKLKSISNFEFLNIVGQYESLTERFARELKLAGKDYTSDSLLKAIDNHYKKIAKKGKGWAIIIDEFGKSLEYASKNNPEHELYFIQLLAEYANDTDKNVFFITTLHQDFNAYAFKLSKSQKDEWSKVKGRLKEATFNEPVEQLLFLASERIGQLNIVEDRATKSIKQLFNSIQNSKAFPLKDYFNEDIARKLLPFDILAASIMTLALQTYGQNERSLFSFIETDDYLGLRNFPKDNNYYNLSCVYDYLIHNYYSLLSTKYNPHYSQWAAIRIALERAEGVLSGKDFKNAAKIIKSIGLLNIFATFSAKIDKKFLKNYGSKSLGITNPESIIKELEDKYKIIRYVKHSTKYILFEGTDLDIEQSIENASVDTGISVVHFINQHIQFPYLLAKANLYKNGTPRYFQFILSEEPIIEEVEGEIDGYINLIFSDRFSNAEIMEFSGVNKVKNKAILYVYFKNYEAIKSLIIEVEKINKVKSENLEDKVATRELDKILDYQHNEIYKTVLDNLYSDNEHVYWYFRGEKLNINSRKILNQQLSEISNKIYHKTPKYKSELVNKTKLSGNIATARKKLLTSLVNNWEKESLGFESDKFPPEKTIYLSLLKNTGIHQRKESGYVFSAPTDKSFNKLWKESEQFLENSKTAKRKISELYDTLTSGAFKLKKGFVDFWIPIFLFIKREDYALFEKDLYIPYLNEEVLGLVVRSPQSYTIKTFSIDGVRLDIFNGYRNLLNLNGELQFSNSSFIETIKPFLTFFKGLPNYAKQTKRLSDKTVSFREAIINSKDPEKSFFEDFPLALGFSIKDLSKGEKELKKYVEALQSSIKELRTCFDNLLNRIEGFINEEVLENEKAIFPKNKKLLQKRFKQINEHLLLPKQKVFYKSIFTKLDDRDSWIVALVQAVTSKTLDSLKDENEDQIYQHFKKIVQDLDNLREISQEVAENDIDTNKETVVKINISSTEIEGTNRVVSFRKKGKTKGLEKKIKASLSKNNSENIEVLLKLLHEQLKNDKS